jgi:hypothetical protein
MAVLTRIRNNQVYNSDINAATKLQPYSITGGLLSNGFVYNGNMTIGNLTVNGNTTTIDTTNLVIADPLFSLNRNVTGTPSYDIGVIMGRGNQTNVAFIWEETAQQFQFQYTTESTAATTFGVINNSGYANIQAYGAKFNNATVTSLNVTNDLVANVAITGGTINNTTIGATVPNTGVFTTVTSVGQVIGYINGAIGANTPNSIVASSVTTSNGGQVSAYFTGIIGGNIPNSATFTTATINSNTNSVGLGSGALVVSAGGAAIQQDLYVGGNLYVANVISRTSQILVVRDPLLYLSANSSSYNYDIGFFSNFSGGNANTYAHTGLVRNYVDNQWYLFSNAPEPVNGVVDLANAALVYDTIRVGGAIVQNATPSTSSASGALQVSGGVGIIGNLNVGSNSSVSGNSSAAYFNASSGVTSNIAYFNYITPLTSNKLNLNSGANGNIVINSSGIVSNLIVNGNTVAGYQNLLTTSGAAGLVGIKVDPSRMVGNASFQINSTDSIIVPAGPTYARPSNGVAGMVRYNTQLSALEFYNDLNNLWQGTGSQFTIIQENTFVGDNNSTAFSLTANSTTAGTIVSINGIVQVPIVAYSVTGSTLTFTEAPLTTDFIDVRILTTTYVVTALYNGNSSISVTDSGSNSANASINTNGTYRYIANVGNTGSNYFTGGIAPSMNPISLTQNTPTVIDYFSTAAFRSSKYIIQVSDSTNSVYSSAEMLVTHDGTTPTSQVYGVVNTGSNTLAQFSTTISSGNVYIQANSWSSTAKATVFPTYMPV